ncbi:MAG: COX15/CtaA family protein [Marinobacterium sp.]|nr:COX15/CtaA family protein [Marinobacterium sp.]
MANSITAPSDNHALQRLIRLANAALMLVLVVVLLGGWTRLNDAGLGCPDWPGCYGELVLPASSEALAQAQARYPQWQLDQTKGWLEMIHRYAAGSLGLLIAAIAWCSWRQRQQIRDVPVQLAFGLLALVTVQALFGMWTVTLKLLPQVVTLHLLGGLTTLTLLVLFRHRLLRLQQAKVGNGSTSSGLIRIAIGLLFLQLTLGGWTSANYAGWACTDWLQCNSEQQIGLDYQQGFDLSVEIGPNYEGGLKPIEARAAIQVVHRWMAVVLVAWLLWLCWRLKAVKPLYPWLGLVVSATLLQVLLGVANIIWALPLALATAHHAGAVVLLLSLLWLHDRSADCPQEVLHASERITLN